MQAVIQLALEGPLELGMVEVAGMQLKMIGVHWNRWIFELDDDFYAFALHLRIEIEQGMFVQTKLIQNALQAVV